MKKVKLSDVAYAKAEAAYPIKEVPYNGVEGTYDENLYPRLIYAEGYDVAMAELKEKIAQVKKNGTWDGVDVDEFMKQFRGE